MKNLTAAQERLFYQALLEEAMREWTITLFDQDVVVLSELIDPLRLRIAGYCDDGTPEKKATDRVKFDIEWQYVATAKLLPKTFAMFSSILYTQRVLCFAGDIKANVIEDCTKIQVFADDVPVVTIYCCLCWKNSQEAMRTVVEKLAEGNVSRDAFPRQVIYFVETAQGVQTVETELNPIMEIIKAQVRRGLMFSDSLR